MSRVFGVVLASILINIVSGLIVAILSYSVKCWFVVVCDLVLIQICEKMRRAAVMGKNHPVYLHVLFCVYWVIHQHPPCTTGFVTWTASKTGPDRVEDK